MDIHVWDDRIHTINVGAVVVAVVFIVSGFVSPFSDNVVYIWFCLILSPLRRGGFLVYNVVDIIVFE